MSFNPTLVNTIILIGLGIGAGFAYFRYARSNVQDLTIKALEARIADQERTIQQLMVQMKGLETQVASLQTANKMLTDLLQGRPEWAVISKSLETINNVAAMAPQWREEAVRREQAIMDALNELLDRKAA